MQPVVISSSKVLKLKAIHNKELRLSIRHSVVISSSKVLKLKAIHNFETGGTMIAEVVISSSKVLKLKAIHNKKILQESEADVVISSFLCELWWLNFLKSCSWDTVLFCNWLVCCGL